MSELTTTHQAPVSHRICRRWVGPVLAAVCAVGISVVALGGKASAATTRVAASTSQLAAQANGGAPPVPGQNGSQSFICSGTSDLHGVDQLLPISRWGSAAGGTIHTRLSANPLGDISSKIQRNFLESGAMSMGNAVWTAGTGLTNLATRFCFADGAGAAADRFAVGIGDALSYSGVISALVALTLIMLLWRAARGTETPWKQLGRSVIILALFSVMLIGASKTRAPTNPDGSPAPGAVTYGTFSPGWLATKVNGAISTVASLPASAIAQQSNGLNGLTTDTNSIGCGPYVRALLTRYQASYGPDSLSQSAAVVPMALDAMWEQTGLKAYINTQFGGDNDFGRAVYCRLLEDNIGGSITGANQLNNTLHTSPPPPASLASKSNVKALAWLGSSTDNKSVDRSIIGWAACQVNNGSGTWTIPADWAAVTNSKGSGTGATGDHITAATCDAWWSQNETAWDNGSSALEWLDDAGAINDATTNATPPAPHVADFLLNFHGDANAGATSTAITFAISSLVIFIVFAVLSLAIIVSKVALLLMMALSLLVLVLALFPSSGVGNRAAGFFKHALSLILFSAAAQVILSLVAIVTGFVNNAGVATFGAGSFMSILWMAFAPIAAVFVIHNLFKHVLKAPSPFKPTSALAWGAAAGGLGAGLGAGAESMFRRHGYRARQEMMWYARGRMGMRQGGRRSGRSGGMADSTRPGMGGPGSGGTSSSSGGGGRGGAGPGALAGAAVGGGGTGGGGGGPGGGPGQSANARATAAAAAANQGRQILRDQRGGYVGSARSAVSDRAKLAVERFRAKPIRNSLKVAGAMATVASLPVATLPAMAAAAAVYGVHKARQANRERPARRVERQQQRVNAYTAAQPSPTTPPQPGPSGTTPPPPPAPPPQPRRRPPPPVPPNGGTPRFGPNPPPAPTPVPTRTAPNRTAPTRTAGPKPTPTPPAGTPAFDPNDEDGWT